MNPFSQFVLGLLLAVLIAWLAYRARSLNLSGACAAALTGTVIFGIGGWRWAVLLLTFFITSSILSRSFDRHKRSLHEKYSKGHERDVGQVLGNGGVATLFAALHGFFPGESWPWLGFAASLAAVNADTWATELGVLIAGQPRLITNPRRVVEKGTSGGISPFGTVASLAGAALIAALTTLLTPHSAGFPLFLALTLAGVAGALFDSFLGATVQAIYFCEKDQKETEQHPSHSCGSRTIQVRGWSWLNNDLVNLACGASGVLIFFLLP